MASRVEFLFRIWVHPVDGDCAEVQTWYQGLEPTKPGGRYVAEWAEESLNNEDFHQLFNLDTTKHWQVVGRATLAGSFDTFGEYDEELTVVEYEKEEVAADWFDATPGT